MGIKQRFMVMIGLVVLLLAAVSGIGYYMAQSILSDSVKSQLTAIVKDQGSQLDTWIESKAAILDGVGNALSRQSADVSTTKQTLPYLGAIAGDKEILDLTSPIAVIPLVMLMVILPMISMRVPVTGTKMPKTREVHYLLRHTCR